jgi:malonyl-CoA O-methyltransferase
MADAIALAHTIDRLARLPEPPWLHGEVARRMAERLPVIKRTPSRLIDWWGWLGAGGDELAKVYPKARRIVVEPTAALAERSAADAKRPWWRFGAPGVEVVRQAEPASAELLWANMMLHLASDPPALMSQWRRSLAVDGFLMFSTLGPDTLAELRTLYRELGWPAPVPAFTDMHDIGDQLVHAGFADPVMDQEHLSLTWATPEALLAELRTLGGNSDPARHAALRTPRWHERLRDALRGLADADGRLRLGFEIVYGHAFNPAPRAPLAAQTEVSLDAMRAMVRGRGARRG